MVDLDQQFILSQLARRGPWNDCGNLPAVVETAAQDTRIGLVLADAEFDSERNHTYIREQLGARKENVASARSASPDAAGLPARDLPPPRIKRECLLFGQKKALGSVRGPAHYLCRYAKLCYSTSISCSQRPRKKRMSTEPNRF